MVDATLSSLTAFANALLAPDAATPDGIINPDGAPATRRFNVYRNNVIVSLIDALAARYPVVQKLVGEEFFAAMGREYALKNPPTSPVMLNYGTGFPDFIADFPPAASLPYLADVAAIETARRCSYHAADAAPLDPARLQEIAPENLDQLRFLPHPALYLVSSSYAAHAIWQANHTDTPLTKPIESPEAVLITRPAYDVATHLLPEGGANFFQSLIQGERLGQAAGQGLLAAPGFDLSANLTLALQSGAFTDFLT